METNIDCFAIVEYKNSIKILAFYSPSNIPKLHELKNIFSNPNFNIKPGIISSFTYELKSYFLLADINLILFVVVTKQNYPIRLAGDCLKELESSYSSKQTNLINIINTTNTDLSLNKNFLQIFKKLYEKYNVPESFDKLVQVKDKVNLVKDTMHNNIALALENTIKLDYIELKSEELAQSAKVFKISTRELKNKMWWKNFKMKLMIFSIIAIILTIIISIAVVVSTEK